MIRENREKIYLKLKSDLGKERIFSESNKKEKILDEILENMGNVDIYYINSNKASNSVRFFEKNAVIIWDMKYWQYFEEYLMQVHNCRQFNMNVIQGIICVISKFLSEKYKNIYYISSFLGQINDSFGIGLQSLQKYCKKVYSIIDICKLFSFFHEIGHLEYYKKDNIEIYAYQKLVLMMFNTIKDNKLPYLGIWKDLGQQIVSRISLKRGEMEKAILEELVADIYAIIYTIKLYQKLVNVDEFQAICDCMIAEEYISTFQNMFTAINKAWDAHYAEMKFRLPIRKKGINKYINELAVARNGIGSLILIFVVQEVFDLNEEHCNFLLECIDKNHIENKEVIDCLADDEFICTAIEEALQ